MKPCNRLVLVRNAQAERHLAQQKGDMSPSDSLSAAHLTAKGQTMAKALSLGLPRYLHRPECSNSGETLLQAVNLVCAREPACLATITEINKGFKESTWITNDDINTFDNIPKDKINVFIHCCTGLEIRTFVESVCPNLKIGPPLGSCTIIDFLDNGKIFVHAIADTSALALGGYDTSTLFYWNNTQ